MLWVKLGYFDWIKFSSIWWFGCSVVLLILQVVISSKSIFESTKYCDLNEAHDAMMQVTTPLLFKLIPAVVHIGVLLRWFSPDSSIEVITCPRRYSCSPNYSPLKGAKLFWGILNMISPPRLDLKEIAFVQRVLSVLLWWSKALMIHDVNIAWNQKKICKFSELTWWGFLYSGEQVLKSAKEVD